LDATSRATGVPDPDGSHLLVLARGPEGYRRLSRSIANAHLASGAKGEAQYQTEELADLAAGNWLVLTGCRKGSVRRALEPHPGDFDLPAARRERDRRTDLVGADNVAVEITATGDPLHSGRPDAHAQPAADTPRPPVAT